MDKGTAKRKFKKAIAEPCETCGAPAGELCDTPAVWVHLSRLQRIHPELRG